MTPTEPQNTFKMTHIQLKVRDEGLRPDITALKVALRYHLAQDGIFIDHHAPLTLKVKFFSELEREKVLLVLRDTTTKEKMGEKVLHYMSGRWLQDITNEAHALVANLVVKVA